jgi:predicted DNA-binding transcriptional regulator AlpA
MSDDYFNEIAKDIKKNYPEFLRPTDLVATGLYKSRSDLCWSMKRGLAPPCIKLSSHKVIFPRASIIEWLKQKDQMK